MAESDFESSSFEENSFSSNSSFEFEDLLEEDEVEVLPYQFEPLADSDEDETDEEDELEENGRAGNTNWCRCNSCVPMQTDRESVCCQEQQAVERTCEEFNQEGGSISCIVHHPGFQTVCLDRYVLKTAYYQYQQQYGGKDQPGHERNRYIAYRQFVRWCYGYLGKEIRVVLPSCAVERIRKEFPSDHYKGFEEA